MKSAQKGGGVCQNIAQSGGLTEDFADRGLDRGSKNPKLMWTSYMEAP